MNLKQKAREIFMEAVKAADPYSGIKNVVNFDAESIIIAGEKYTLDYFTRVIIIGAGKASARMGQAIEDILGDCITDGWINTKDGHAVPLGRIKVQECGHPIPDERGIEGTKQIIKLLQSADEHTLVICLLSGGGSSLSPAPTDGITLEEKQHVTRLLLNAGASIEELNAVRKHLSIIKGGGIARLASPAALHVLILSDVIGDRLDTIASGPSVSDRSTYQDCIEICIRYRIMDSLPANVRERLTAGARGELPETAKDGDIFLSSVKNTLIGNNRMSVETAKLKAEESGFNTLVLSTVLEGEAKEIGTAFASIASEIIASGNPVPMPACIIAGGETTVTVRGEGKGGRNQEMALSAALHISGLADTIFLSGGTDGTDGPTDAAGGIVDGETSALGKENNIEIRDYLDRNDSYTYLKNVGGLLVTGPTGTNVMDIQILLVGKLD
ncbi:glycerate kinase [Candidatus Latescibacterota bacterium]